MGKDLFGPLSVSGSGLSAQRKRMEAIARNIANAETTRSEEGDLYRRRAVRIEGSGAPPAGGTRARPHRVSLVRTSPAHMFRSGSARPGSPGESGVQAEEVDAEGAPFLIVFDPEHPDADEEGFVRMPNINIVTEMVDMVTATRAYEANLAAMKAYQNMVNRSLEI